jgi:outer membrane receptor protein involved in Fe transport
VIQAPISQRRVARATLAFAFLFGFIGVLRATEPMPLPTDVQILTQDDFRAHNYMSVAEALRGHTSLKIEQDGYRGTRAILKMRGLSSASDVVVLLDGRPINHEFDGQVDLSQIPLEMVDRIEITRGGSSVLYSAQAAAGVINIITVRPYRKGLVSEAGYAIGRHGAKSADGRFVARSNIGDLTFVPTRHAAGGFSANEDYASTSYFGNYTRSFNGKGYWGAEYFYNAARVGLSNGTPVPYDQWNGIVEETPSTLEPQRTQEMQHVKAFFAVPLIAGGTTYATATQSWRQSDDRATRSGVSLLDKTNRTSTADITWRKSSFSIGYQSRQLEREIFANPNRSTFENSVFATQRVTFGKFSALPGLRYENESRTGGFLAPRLAMTYAPIDAILFSGTVQRSHRVPTFDEYFSTTNARVNNALDDEKIWSYDLGAQWSPSLKAMLRVTGFYTHVQDAIGPNADFSDYFNQGTERTHGVETEFHWNNRPGDPERIESGLAWTVQRGEISLDTAPGWVSSAMTPEHLFSFSVDKHMRHAMVFSNELRYQTKEYELPNQQGLKLPHFLLWNARFALRILAADLYFAVDNVTNTHYAETFATAAEATATNSVLAPQPTRTYWTGFSIRFID